MAKAVPDLKIEAVLETLDTKAHHNTNIKVGLGKLTLEQCKKVASIYADSLKPGLSGVNCVDDANKRAFFLEDFSTPVMQALYRTTFVSESEELASSKGLKTTHLETNCVSTAFEVARREAGSSPEYSVHLVDNGDADRIFKSETYTKLRTGPAASGDVKKALEKWGAKFGDLLIIRDVDDYGNPTIAHAAVFVDGGLLFEKVTEVTGMPHRFITFDQIAKTHNGAKATFEVRSIVKDFPHIRSIPNVKLSGSYEAEGSKYSYSILIRDLKLTKAAGQKYALPLEAFKPLK